MHFMDLCMKFCRFRTHSYTKSIWLFKFCVKLADHMPVYVIKLHFVFEMEQVYHYNHYPMCVNARFFRPCSVYSMNNDNISVIILQLKIGRVERNNQILFSKRNGLRFTLISIIFIRK